jgi:hypothetical protein
MPTFTDEQQVYDRLGRAFQSLADDPETAVKLKRSNLVVQYQFRKPESTITVKLLREEDLAVEFGPTTFRTEVVYAMDADTAHNFFLGELNVTVALSRGDIRASGPIKKILEVVPTVMPLIPLYRAATDAEAPPGEDGEAETEMVDAEHDEAPASEELETSSEEPEASSDEPAAS